MTFTAPIPFREALTKLAEKQIVPSGLDSAGWAAMPLALRERAFFSSKVESARVLQAMQDQLGDFLAGTRMENGGFKAHSRAEFVADMRALAIREGLGVIDPETGDIDPKIRESDLTDIRSLSRLQLIFDTVTESAQEYGYYAQGQSPEILDVFPAQRFIRVRPVQSPRAYHAAAEGEVRAKDDQTFWLSMNRDFNVPWGPWGFNSGMGVEDVDRDEAESLGVITKDQIVKPNLQGFNAGLSAGVRDLDADLLAKLQRITGGSTAKGRLTPAAPVPGRPTDLASALATAGAPGNGDLTVSQARKLLDSLKQAKPAAASQKIATIKGGQRTGQLSKKFITGTVQDLFDFFPPSLIDSLPDFEIHVKRGMGNSAGTYSQDNHRLSLNARALQDPAQARKTIFHELTHWIHDHGPKSFQSQVRRHFVDRTRGEKVQPLRPWNVRSITGKRDKWLDADGDEYAGRIYPWEAVPAGTEVVTRHFEKLSDPAAFTRNWNHKASDGSHAWRETFTELSSILFP